VAIGLGALLVVQQPHPGRQRRWHVEHLLAGCDELLRQQGAGAGGALDRPHARFVAMRPVQQLLALLTVGGHRHLVVDLFAVVEHDRDV
jgi:hypothetical protein